MSGATSRNLCSGRPSSSASERAWTCGSWLVAWWVSRPLAGVVFRQDRAAFHAGGGDAAVDQAPTHHDVGFAQRAADVAPGAAVPEGEVARRLRMQLRRGLLHRRLLIGGRRQRLVGGLQGGQRGLRGLGGLGGHRRDGLADVAYALARQHRMQRRRLHAGRRPVAGQVDDPFEVFGREHGRGRRWRTAAASIPSSRAWAWGERSSLTRSAPEAAIRSET